MFCNSNGICTGNTYFKHKLTHKKKCWSPDGTVENEIDYIYINQRLRSVLSDVRAYRRADIGSDHQLVIATLKLKFKKILKPKVDKPHNIEKFKNQKVRRGNIDLVYCNIVLMLKNNGTLSKMPSQLQQKKRQFEEEVERGKTGFKTWNMDSD